MRPLIDLAYRVQKQLWRPLRPRTRGVKVMLFNGAGELLLIRNNYGGRDLFVLPGGGIRPWERPEQAAIREVSEELSCGIEQLQPVSTHFSGSEGKRDTIYLFRARLVGDPRPDHFEVAEAHFFQLGALPHNVSPATRRRVEELRRVSVLTEAW